MEPENILIEKLKTADQGITDILVKRPEQWTMAEFREVMQHRHRLTLLGGYLFP